MIDLYTTPARMALAGALQHWRTITVAIEQGVLLPVWWQATPLCRLAAEVVGEDDHHCTACPLHDDGRECCVPFERFVYETKCCAGLQIAGTVHQTALREAARAMCERIQRLVTEAYERGYYGFDRSLDERSKSEALS